MLGPGVSTMPSATSAKATRVVESRAWRAAPSGECGNRYNVPHDALTLARPASGLVRVHRSDRMRLLERGAAMNIRIVP